MNLLVEVVGVLIIDMGSGFEEGEKKRMVVVVVTILVDSKFEEGMGHKYIVVLIRFHLIPLYQN